MGTPYARAVIQGQVYWTYFEPGKGHEQHGRRPVVVVSGSELNQSETGLVWVVPVTTRDRNWETHLRLKGPLGLTEECFAMTEQLRCVSRGRLKRLSGAVSEESLSSLLRWLQNFLAP